MLTIRICVLLASLWSGIMSIYYANLANINFGIISCCFIFSIVVNISCGYAFFEEKISKYQIIGIIITLSGIIWISLAKGAGSIKASLVVSEEEAKIYKFLSVLLALCVGTMNASFTV